MKTLVKLLCLITFNITIAQVSVRNNNYIFVKNTPIYSEDYVNLNETDSRIFLRDEGQLIQGSGTTGNSGIGELSVFQNGNVGAYEYNYWCSPIGSKISNNVNNPFGVPFLNDIVDVINSNPANYSIHSNYNGTASPLDIDTFWIWKFIASDTYADWIYVGENIAINPGEGFTMKGTTGTSANNPGDLQNYDFRGKPNTGTISSTVLNEQFTLVGNPYPSAIDAAAFIHDVENSSVINGVLYYWEQDPNINSHYIGDYDGGYATYTIASDGSMPLFVPAVFYTYNGDGTINALGSNPSVKQARRYIPIGQGFMVEGQSNGIVKAKNSHRVYQKESSLSSEFFRINPSTDENRSSFSSLPNYSKRFRLNINFNDTYTRQLVETFHPTATEGFDYGLEIKLTEPLSTDAFWSINNEAYIAEALVFNEDLVIPLILNIEENMIIDFKAIGIVHFDEHPIFLYDSHNDLYINLKEQSYSLNLESGIHDNRFEIRFKTQTTLGLSEQDISALKILQDNSKSQLIISNPNLLDIKSIKVFDVSGKLVINKLIQANVKKHFFPTSSFSDGVYIVNIKLRSNSRRTSKIIIGN